MPATHQSDTKVARPLYYYTYTHQINKTPSKKHLDLQLI